MTSPSPKQPKSKAYPPDKNNKKAAIRNFLANKECFNWMLFIAVLIFACTAIYFFIHAHNISQEHLNKTQQLLQEIKEGRDTTNETIKEIDSLRNTFSSHGLYLLLSLIILVSCFSKPIMKLLNNYPQRVFVAVIALGGFLAFSIPQYLYSFKYIGETKDITASLLTVTGGILAVFTLLKTHQKSELEREQLDTQKKKDDRDHIRQLHDSYNDRFDKAVAELNSNDVKAAYAAVPKLAKLADAWLDYEDLSNDTEELEKLKKKAKKEAQTIINILCKYIRTMPGEYTEEGFKEIRSLATASPDKLKSESEVRRLIFSEMSDRFIKSTSENENLTTAPGIWGEFNFDFTRAPIFYPLNNLTIEKGIFTSAKFYGNADFSGSTFVRDVAFKGVQFAQGANFNEVTFNEAADFSAQGDTKTIFGGDATFNGTRFTQKANFNEVTFNGKADFSTQGDTKTIFGGDATFNGTRFTQKANFNEVTFNGKADFSTQGDARTIFGGEATFNGTRLTQEAYFDEVTFNGKADFSSQKDAKTTFVGKASFTGADFSSEAHFDELTFKEVADFSTRDNAKTTFDGKTTFNGTHFTQEAKFTEVTFNESADFSAQSDIKTIFGARATFNDVQFHKEISFNKVIFEGIADFSTKKLESFNETFMSDAKFTDTHFKKTADFSYVHSHSNNKSQKIYFKQVDFHEDSLFNNTEFQTDVHFEKTVFHRKAKFNDAIFLKSAKFYNKTNFQGEAIFSGLTVWMNTEFKNVSFDDKSYFNGAILSSSTSINQQETCFYESRFDEDADFSGVHFCGINKFIDLYFFKEVSFYDSTFVGDTFFIQNPNNYFAVNKFTSPAYKEKAEFSDAKFEGKLHFENIKFNDGADFIRTVFCKESNFENILFKDSSPDFEDAKFTVHSSHRFTTSQNSIPCRRKKVRVPRNNKLKARKIPIGSYLFDDDPDNPIAGPA